jgi:glycosyltransferase involved in cell wall biosynthesis
LLPIADGWKSIPAGWSKMNHELDIVIPVYNESLNILSTLGALARGVKSPARVLICYDFDDDDTLPAVRNHPETYAGLEVALVHNPGRGAHAAVMAGFAASTAPIVVVYPADDDFNAGIIDGMVALVRDGCDIVCASRFMPGGTMQECPWLKAILVRTAAFTLHHFAGLPTRDPTSGFRMFSRRVIDGVKVESDQGFCYSIELLVKARLADCRGAGKVVRTLARDEPLPRVDLVAGLSALVQICLRHQLSAPVAGHGDHAIKAGAKGLTHVRAVAEDKIPPVRDPVAMG